MDTQLFVFGLGTGFGSGIIVGVIFFLLLEGLQYFNSRK